MKFCRLAAFAALILGSVQAHAVYIVGGNGLNVASNSGSWAWDSTVHALDRTILEDASVFGPTGTVVGDTIDTVDLGAINPTTLAGLDAFVSSWWLESQSAPYDQMVVDFFLNGGDLYLFNDGPNRDSIADLLGVPTFNAFGGNPSTVVSGTALDGPFGTGPINQGGQIGSLTESQILAQGGEVCARNASNVATAACWAAGDYAVGAGSLIVLADVDMLSGGTYSGTTPTNGESQLWLNMFAFGVSDTAPVPAPATFIVFALGALLVRLGRRS